MASPNQNNETGSASSARQTNRSQAALQLWEDLSEFLLSDEENLDIFTCSCCDDLMLGVVVITKCQHGCCESCIEQHIFDNGINQCPRCEIELGDNPRQYLWRDELTTDLIDLVAVYHGIRNSVVQPEPEANTVAQPGPPEPEPNADSDAANRAANP